MSSDTGNDHMNMMMNDIAIDPILPTYAEEDDISRYLASSVTDTPLPPLSIVSHASSNFTLPVDKLLSPDMDSAISFSSDLAFMWGGGERKRVSSVKQEAEDGDTFIASSPTSAAVMESDADDEDDHSEMEVTPEIKEEGKHMDAFDYEAVSPVSSVFSPAPSTPAVTNRLGMTEQQARKYVDNLFQKVAIMPDSSLDHRGKISYILQESDCKDYSVQDILNFDKTTAECALACAKIVQNIPQSYRWWCVEPEDIPKCYTIVCDCKKKAGAKPPRPMNAFMIWSQGCRRLINILCTKMQNALISKALGHYWGKKTEEFRQSFGDEKLRIRRFHAIEYPEYKYKPETKSQKLLKKQQLTLSKVKTKTVVAASVKKEKAPKASQKAKAASKSGRAKKSDTALPPKVSKPAQSRTSAARTEAHSVKGLKGSPTKPAIKDMLTLKIMNDRKSRASPQAVSHSFGQLSPLELEMTDIFTRELDVCLDAAPQVATRAESVNGGSAAMPSSVYDTPASTPPIDEPGQSPQPHHTPLRVSVSSPVSMVPSSEFAGGEVSDSSLPPNSSTAAAPSPTQALMPSLTAILSSPPASSNTNMPIRVLGGLKTAQISCLHPQAMSGQRLQQFHQQKPGNKTTTTSYVLTSVAQALVPLTGSSRMSESRLTPGTSTSFRIVPVVNSVKVERIPSRCDPCSTVSPISLSNGQSHESTARLRPLPAHAMFISDLRKYPCPPETLFAPVCADDLETLSLDVSGPLLSDDDMDYLLQSL